MISDLDLSDLLAKVFGRIGRYNYPYQFTVLLHGHIAVPNSLKMYYYYYYYYYFLLKSFSHQC